MFGSWRTVRVFLSSTFRDMHAERDHLVKVTFPHLRQWCSERRLHLVDVDLRWGVTREEADDGRALAVCLQEIDACRPFFLCLLGARYGWVPGPARIPAEAFARFPGLAAHPDRSITHLEIVHAVEESLNPAAPHPPCAQVFCYFRDAGCLPRPEERSELTEAERQAYREAFFEQDPQLAAALVGLKQSLRRRFQDAGRVCDYAGSWDGRAPNPEDDALVGRLTRLEAFGARVEADLRQAIAAEFAGPSAAHDVAGPLAEERSLHEAFLEGRTHVHVPRADVEAAVTRYIEGDDARPLVVSGPPGTGKSALLAHWAKDRLAAAPPRELLLARFVGASPASSNLHRLLANVAAELVEQFRLTEEVETPDESGQTTRLVRPLEVPAEPVQLLRKWPSMLAAAGQRGRVVLLLDALEQLDRSADPARLGWLPRPLPAGVRLVVSVLDQGERSLASRPVEDAAGAEPPDWLSRLRRLDVVEAVVPPLTDEDRGHIVHAFPSVFCKRLDAGQAARLLENQATRNALFLTVALEELRLFGSFAKLPAVVERLPRLDDPGVAGDIDRALDRLFGQVLERLEEETQRQAPGLVPALFRLLAASREGLSEPELHGALARSLPDLPDAERDGTLQVVLRQVRSYLMRKGLRRGTLVDFYHRSFWKAARARYLAGPAVRRRTHQELGDYFAGQPNDLSGSGERVSNERKLAELPWQLLQAASAAAPDLPEAERQQAWDRLAGLLGDWAFLEAKAEAGLLGELVLDFADTLERLPAAHPRRPLLRLLEEALRVDLAFLTRHPSCLFQCLWNRGWWYDAAAAGGPGPRPAPGLSALLEAWRAGKERTAPPCRWVRALQPPDQLLGSGQRAVLRGHQDVVASVAFSADGRQLASGSLDGTVRLWDARAGTELLCLRGTGAGVAAVLLAPTGRHLLAAAVDGTVQVWDVPGGSALASLHGPSGVRGGAFSADGRYAAFACDRAVSVYEMTAGQEVACLQGRGRGLHTVALALDGRHVAALDDDGLRVWHTESGREVLRRRSPGEAAWSLAFAPDGGRLACGSGLVVRVWEVPGGRCLAALHGHTRGAFSLAWAPDAQYLVSGGGPGDNTVRLWDVGAGRELACLRGHEGEVRAVAFAADGRHVASAGDDRTIRLWEAVGAPAVRTHGGHEGPLKCVVFAPDGTRLASGGGMFDNSVRLWDARDGGEAGCLRGHKADVRCLAFAPNGGCLASGSRDHTIRLWNAGSGRELACLRGHLAEVRGLAFAPDGRRLVSGAADRTLRLWDVAAGRELACLRGGESEVGSVAFAPDGRGVAAGFYDGTVRVWDTVNGAVLASWRGHEGTVGSLAYSPDGARFVSAGTADRTVRTWDGHGGCLDVLTGVGGLGDVGPLAAGTGRFPWRAVTRGAETVIEAAATGEVVGRLPDLLARIVTHPSGRAWAGIESGQLYFADRSRPYLFTLEGYARRGES
jgi:WD40 repeat protein